MSRSTTRVAFALGTLLAAAAPSQAPVTVAVVDARTAVPCADAAVWIVDQRDAVRRVPADPFVDAGVRAERHGRELRTGTDGRAALPAGMQPVEVTARAGSRWGRTLVPGGALPRTLFVAVDADPAVEVRILDAVGAPSAVAAIASTRMPGGMGNYDSLRLRADPATGIAHLRPARLWRFAMHGMLESRVDDSDIAEVGLDVVAPATITATIDRAAPRRVTLVAPPTGALVLRVVDATGRAIADGYATAWIVATLDRMPTGPNVTVPIVDGVARFAAVVLEATVRVQITPTLDVPVAVVVAGPTAQANVAERTVVWTPPPERRRQPLRGRFVRADGTPLATTAFRADFATRSTAPQALLHDGQSGADGTFRITAIGPCSPGDEVRFVLAGADWSRPAEHIATAELPATDTSELGTVVVRDAPLLLAGNVVDANGEPTAARLSLHEVGRDSSPMLCEGMHEVGAHGAFRVFGKRVVRGVLDVAVHTPAGDRAATVRLAAGAADARIVMPATHAVIGRVVLPDARLADRLRVQLVPMADWCDEGRWMWRIVLGHQVPVQPDGTFVATTRTLGSHHLAIWYVDAFAVAGLDDVEVTATGADDPRLAAIDLRKALRQVLVTVDVGEHTIAPRDELVFAPVEPWGAPRQRAVSLTAELRLRPQRVWLPTGDFTVALRLGDAPAPAEPTAILDDLVHVRAPAPAAK